jgi:hypothetical protein
MIGGAEGLLEARRAVPADWQKTVGEARTPGGFDALEFPGNSEINRQFVRIIVFTTGVSSRSASVLNGLCPQSLSRRSREFLEGTGIIC